MPLSSFSNIYIIAKNLWTKPPSNVHDSRTDIFFMLRTPMDRGTPETHAGCSWPQGCARSLRPIQWGWDMLRRPASSPQLFWRFYQSPFITPFFLWEVLPCWKTQTSCQSTVELILPAMGKFRKSLVQEMDRNTVDIPVPDQITWCIAVLWRDYG